MPSTATGQPGDTAAPPARMRSRDVVYRAVAVAVVVIAAAVAVVLLGRGNDSGGTGQSTVTPAADAGTGPVDREFRFTIANRVASPPTSRAEIARGSTIRITVTSDAPDELHVHGYDRRATLSPGVPASVRFRADTAGLFEVETHGSKLVLLQLEVR
ncbi:hypothetical protein [Dactylosporangium sp. CA-092794]|uniref:hypothetical protein n=1 Tax=Dactylosporangium sp. CA-092794 TaxID=3239929 RepID=UPI003D929FD7